MTVNQFEAYLRGIETAVRQAADSAVLLFEAYLRGIETPTANTRTVTALKV